MVYGYFSSATNNEEQMEQQRKMIENYCKENKYDLGIYFGDSRSGLEIGEYLRMMLDNLKDGDIVVVKDYSRLTRNTSKLNEVITTIVDKGAELKIIEGQHEDTFIQDIVQKYTTY